MRSFVLFIFTLSLFSFITLRSEDKTPKSQVKITKKTKKKIRRRRRRRKKKSISFIDDTRRFISTNWKGLNYNLDIFFSDQKYKKDQNKAKIVVAYDIFKKEDQKIEHYYDLSIKVHFPKVSKKLSLTIEKERDEVLASRENTATQGQATKEADYTAQANFVLNDASWYKTKLETGFRFTLPLDPYGRLKLYSQINHKYVDIFLGQKFIYFKQEGLSEVTQLSFSKQVTRKFTFIQNNALTWTDEDDTFINRNSITLAFLINRTQALTYNAGANAYLSPTYYYYQYDFSIGYRRLLYKDWLYGNISAGAEFLKENNWEMQKFVLLRTEVQF